MSLNFINEKRKSMNDDKTLILEFDNKDFITIIEKKPRGYENRVQASEYAMILNWEKLFNHFKPLVEQKWGVDAANYTYLISFHKTEKSPPMKVNEVLGQ